MENKILVSVVIVNYNAKTYIEPCLDSVLKTNYDNFEVIVVDNGSSDASPEYLRRVSMEKPVIKPIFNKENLGPAKARNQGVDKAIGECIAFIDNDTTVHPDWIINALKVLDSDPGIGACQCKLIIKNTDNLIDSLGEYLGQNGFLVQVVLPGEEKDTGKYNDIKDIFAAKSAGMFVRRDLFVKIGGFDSEYFIYLEESDLCWRVWLRGFRVVLAPDSIVYHNFGTSSVVLPERIDYLTKFHGTKNYIATWLKNAGLKNLFKVLPVHIGIWIAVALIFLSRGRFKSAKWIFQGILWNARNFRKIMGKREIVQSLRVCSDAEIFPKIIRKKSFGYFCAKLQRNKKIGNATGWDKEKI
ncbi:MAG: glycosyltransferase family 2 protein [Candidatus Omnitrophica bacterium]|nr:glycosyltransferase family 2 protein [Candidatus Omnitrophota bacterium]